MLQIAFSLGCDAELMNSSHILFVSQKYCTRHGESASLLSTTDSTSYDRLKVVEWKLMLVPVFFIVLRVWTLALTIKFVYLQPSSSETISTGDYWLFYVAVSALRYYIRVFTVASTVFYTECTTV